LSNLTFGTQDPSSLKRCEDLLAPFLAQTTPPYNLSVEEGVFLYQNAPLEMLQKAALSERQRRNPGNRASYLVDRNINYTNVCITNCQFCEFFRAPGHKESYVLSYEELSQKVRELEAIGGSRILMQGGHHPDLKLKFYTDLLQYLTKNHPTIRLDCFSPSEIQNLAQIEGKTNREILQALKDAGLGGLPGGGAEILDDSIRSKVSPLKINTQTWLDIMADAHSVGLSTSASMVIGFGESLEIRLKHLERLRNLQKSSLEKYGSAFTAFIAWPLQLDDSRYGKKSERHQHIPDHNEYYRHMSIARLFLNNFDHIQSSWPTLGPEVACVALKYGMDDFGSTMMEENVVSQASNKTYQRMTPAIIEHYIRKAGYVPWQRNTLYQEVINPMKWTLSDAEEKFVKAQEEYKAGKALEADVREAPSLV